MSVILLQTTFRKELQEPVQTFYRSKVIEKKGHKRTNEKSISGKLIKLNIKKNVNLF